MKKTAFILSLVSLAIVGCGPEIHTGPELTETGEVYDVAFVPKGHGKDTAIGFNNGKNGGVTVTPINVRIPERYAVVFKCQHGKFVIDGENGKEAYLKLEKGDKVKIRYSEVFSVENGKTNVIDLDYIGADKF